MIGTVLGHCRVVGKIGEGGMGIVYRAYDEVLHRNVAVKVLKKVRLSTPPPDRIFCRKRELRPPWLIPNLYHL